MNLDGEMKRIDSVIAKGPFSADWDSLGNYIIPEWYQNDKFGIFIHWGPYCVPAFGSEWYPRHMYKKDAAEYKHHLETFGPHAKFGYKDFFPMFKAEKFNADEWADIFSRSGARFVMPVAEHHDGFAMYDCGFSRWTSTKMGPMRDTTGEIADAVRKKGMTFALSTHRAEHWWFMNGANEIDSDLKADPSLADLYGPAQPDGSQPDDAWMTEWLVRTCELVDKYQPQIVWFDWWIEQPAWAPYLKMFAAYYYNRGVEWGKGVAINYKYAAFPDNVAVYDVERGQCGKIRPLFWQTDTSVAKKSWGYIANQDYKTAGTIIGDLLDVISKNGAMLLNIGPKADGTIPQPEIDLLLGIGEWLKVNGEGVYGTRPWKQFGEGPTKVEEGVFNDTQRGAFTAQDFRFTRREDVVYAFMMAWPENGKAVITSMGTKSAHRPLKITKIEMLGAKGALKWTQDADALTIDAPDVKPCDHVFTFKITPG